MVGRLLGHYRVLEPLGRGGMADVYRALDTRLDRVVALKLLRPETASDPDRTRRFVREAKAASALNHPNIVTVYEIDSVDGTDFIALEYVEGTPLSRLIAGRPLDPQRAVDHAAQIADALSAAHAAGIVHRDLKPANIMVTQSSGRDTIKVLDFGLAKRVESLRSDALTFSLVTRHGALLGTPAYMAPEQVQGHDVDARADVFAFGAVLYEMLAGRMAFSGDSEISTLMAVMSSAPTPLEGVPADLARLVMRCLEKDPLARYASGTELRAAIAHCQTRLAPERQVYEFGPYRLDVALSRLERSGEPITIPPKAFDLLVLLARNQHRVLSKPELMERLWPKTFVEEGNLTQHIYTLRKALGDRPNGKPYIETVPRRGYRLAAELRDASIDKSAAVTVKYPAADVPQATQRSRGAVVLEGERKRATVLHCGIANAGEVAERIGSVEMHHFIDKMLALAQEEVGRYDGVVTQTHPDGFIALFGAREVHEDDARRAILAALGIERRIGDLMPPSSPDEERIAVKIGITTGPLVINRVTDQERVNYVAVGDALGAADLLHQFAEPAAVLISDTTQRAVEKHVRTEPVGRIGRWTAFRVTGLRPEAPSASQAGRALGTFIGREREVSLLDGLLTQALARKGQVVSVVGEPGMGKSRLVYEATRAMADRDEPIAILEGRCVSYGSLVPYLPLIDLLRAHCNIKETDAPEIMRQAIDQAVRDNGLPSHAGAWLLRVIGIVDGATAVDTLSPEAVKARTFDALRLLFLKGAARRPLVIVVEDVHWIDRTSEEFLSTLVGQLVAAHILFIATYRPGYRPPWMDRSYVTQITLAPLSAGDSARLLQSVAGEQRIAAEVSSAILQRGEGNPFFLEELARAVLEQGPDAPPIPETVQGVIMARLDRLPDVPKRLLQTASVVGREVPLRLLTRLWEGSPEFAADILELCRQEFLYERPAADEPVYVFKHALTQDVAYDSLLARRRRDLHLAAARALEELHADRLDETAATLAYHYARTDLIDKAVTWLVRAADQAARVYANAEAILHLDLAARRLQRVPEGPDRDRRMVEVALRHAHSLYFLGRFRESVEVLRPHDARLARLNDPSLAAAYAFWLAHMYSRLGDQRSAADSAERAIEAAGRAGDDATLGKAHGLLALEGHWSGNTADGIAHGEEAVRLLRPRPDQRWWLGMAHFYLAMNHLLAGRFDTALAEAACADAVGREIGDPRLQTYAGFTVGWVEALRDRPDAAIAPCRRSLAQAPDRVSRAYASMILGYALLESGAHLEACALLEPIVVEIGGFGFPQWQALSLALTGECYRRESRLEEASSFVAQGLDIATRARYWYAVGVAHRFAGRIARDRGRAAEAAAAFTHALNTFERIGATFEAARSRRELGLV